MGFVTADRFIADAKRTAVVLNGVLQNVSQEEAMRSRDGAEGWSVNEVVGHLRDFEGFFRHRVELILAEENPILPKYDHEALAIDRDYQHQDLRAVHADLLDQRRSFLEFLGTLTPEQFARTGVHPEAGVVSAFDALVQITHHDLTHLDQITRCLGRSESLF